MFLQIQGGDFTININQISEIAWGAEDATVTMVTGNEYTLEGVDYDRLVEKVG